MGVLAYTALIQEQKYHEVVYSFLLQIWDFISAKIIKDIPQEPLNDSQVYCCQWLGEDSIICGGHMHNMARIIDRGTLNVSIHFSIGENLNFCVFIDVHV